MVERGGLENRCRLRSTVGSNPTPSAMKMWRVLGRLDEAASKAVVSASVAAGFPSDGIRPGESHPLRHMPPRRGARVVEWARLESVCTFTGTEGSNPTPSARLYFVSPGVWAVTASSLPQAVSPRSPTP